MSLILDALKKSEQERQRERAPGLQTIHQPPPRATPKAQRWRWLSASLVLAAATGALVYWVMPRLPISAPAVAGSKPAASVPAPVAPAQQSAGGASGAGMKPATGGQPAAVAAQGPEFTDIKPRDERSDDGASASQLVEEVDELPDDIRNNLPAMTFSFHVYSPNPERRTIIINNRRMREGDEIAQGVRLQQITEDGVILSFRQHLIHINVLSGW